MPRHGCFCGIKKGPFVRLVRLERIFSRRVHMICFFCCWLVVRAHTADQKAKPLPLREEQAASWWWLLSTWPCALATMSHAPPQNASRANNVSPPTPNHIQPQFIRGPQERQRRERRAGRTLPPVEALRGPVAVFAPRDGKGEEDLRREVGRLPALQGGRARALAASTGKKRSATRSITRANVVELR